MIWRGKQWIILNIFRFINDEENEFYWSEIKIHVVMKLWWKMKPLHWVIRFMVFVWCLVKSSFIWSDQKLLVCWVFRLELDAVELFFNKWNSVIFNGYILSALKACARFIIFKLLWRAFYSTFLTWIASIHHKQNSGCEHGPGSAFFTQIVQNWRFHIFYGWIWCLVDEWAGSSLFFQWNAVFWACWAGTVLCRTSVFWVCNFVSLIWCVPGTTVHQQCYLHAKWYNYNNRYKMQISSTNTPADLMFHFCGDLYKLSLCFISSLWNIKATELCNSDFLSNCHFANWRKFEKIKSCKCQFWNWTHKNGG